jgi:tRNA A37 N6-isopentenylltransferase MiaA
VTPTSPVPAQALVVLGPTASGKSDVAMALAASPSSARAFEIVAVDAMQVYRQMDIGTAKPTPEDRPRSRTISSISSTRITTSRWPSSLLLPTWR